MKLGITAPKLEKLWIYGDSQAERLHLSITDGSLCTEIFKSCNLGKMWVYPYSGQFSKWDHKDFYESIILGSLRVVLERTYMSENSVLILNLGLHYMESIRLQDYRILLLKVIDLLNERNKGTGELKHKARVENVHFYKQGEGPWKSTDKWTTKISCSTSKYVGWKQTLELALSSSYLLFLCFFGTLLLFFFVRMIG